MAKPTEGLNVVELRARIAGQGLDRGKCRSLIAKIQVLSNSAFTNKATNLEAVAVDHFLWSVVRAGILETVPDAEPVRFRVTPMGQILSDIMQAEAAGIDVFSESSGNGVQVDG